MRKIPALVGVAGHFQGVVLPLEYGRKIVVGRSRVADLCLRRTEAYRRLSEEAREQDVAAKTVSGKHFEITMYNVQAIELRNLSPNGTFLDGKRIDEAVCLDDVARRSHLIRLGADEMLRLEMRLCEEGEGARDLSEK